jgi:indoleamine 2,3-dioxygenase
MGSVLTERGFLPEPDPLVCFPSGSEFSALDELGRDLPSLLCDPGFRRYARALEIPLWPTACNRPQDLPELRLYYVRIGFLASAYINQVGRPLATELPRNIAVPLCRACQLLGRPPILGYDGYALYNWKRFKPEQPIALGNIDTIQNFVHLYDEHWFILVHVEIEAIGATVLRAIFAVRESLTQQKDAGVINRSLLEIEQAVRRQVEVLQRIPEHMDPALYYKTFRPYIRFLENVVYEGVTQASVSFRGETGAQSSLIPALVAFLKIPHKPSLLTNHLADMRNYMPREHRTLIEEIEAMPSIRELADRDAFNGVLDAVASFREVHYGWAQQYVNRRTLDPRGTGGTPYMEWLRQLIDETRAWQISAPGRSTAASSG